MEQLGLSESNIVIIMLGVVLAVIGNIVFVTIASAAFAEGKTDFVATVHAFAIVGSGMFASLLNPQEQMQCWIQPTKKSLRQSLACA